MGMDRLLNMAWEMDWVLVCGPGMDRLLIMVWEMDWVLACGPVGNGYGPACDYGLGDGPGTCFVD